MAAGPDGMQSASQKEAPQMRLPNTAHTSQTGRTHKLTHDFWLQEVCAADPWRAGRRPPAGTAADLARPVARPPRRSRALRDPDERRRALLLGRPGHRNRRRG